MENTKKCSKCGRELPLESFSKYKRSKDGLFCWCKECHKQYRAEHAEERAAYDKQYRAEHAEYYKQLYQANREERLEYQKQYDAEHAEARKQYNAGRYATIEGYAYNVRNNNLYADRKRGRIAKDEDQLPPLSYHIDKFSEGIDYYDGKHYHWSELGFDRIDDKLPHTVDNMVVATTKHNIDRWHKRMTVEEYKEYIQKQNELELVL